MNSPELRRIFESIIRSAEALGSTNTLRACDIIAHAERGISIVTHLPSEPELPDWEDHERQPHWMVEIGVENDRFNPHLENPSCKKVGCVPAMPIEIPRGTT